MTPKVSDVKLALHCPVSSSDEAGVAVRDSSSFAIIEGSEQGTRDGDSVAARGPTGLRGLL